MIQRTVWPRILRRNLIPASNYTLKIGARSFGTQAASSSVQEACESPTHSATNDAMDWNNLGFGLVETDYMYVMKCGKDDEFKEGQLSRYGTIELSPSAGVLNYGQGVFEGIKAYKRGDGSIVVFRPQENAIRMQIGAERMCMPSPSVHQFVDAVKQTAIANKRWIPPHGKGSLYIRPVVMGSGPVLGVAPSPEYTFLVYASPVGNYFKEGTTSINLYVDDVFHRATRGGAGAVKSITNYAPVLKSISRAKDRGFSDVLFLDSVNKRYVEEASACNVFMLKGNVLSTPEANGTILEGITRKSIIDIARDLGYQVEERPIPIEELTNADEVFCTGTAAGVVPVGSITYKCNRTEYKSTLVSQKLHSRLIEIQQGNIEDSRGWVVEIK